MCKVLNYASRALFREALHYWTKLTRVPTRGRGGIRVGQGRGRDGSLGLDQGLDRNEVQERSEGRQRRAGRERSRYMAETAFRSRGKGGADTKMNGASLFADNLAGGWSMGRRV